MKIKQILSAILSITMIAGIFSLYPCTDNAVADSASSTADRLSAPYTAEVSFAIPDFKDLIGPDVDEIGDISPVAPFGGIDDNVNISTDVNLPESFDLLKMGHGNATKNQSIYETCWSFASAAAGETSLMDALPSINLSELHTAFFPYYGEEGMQLKDSENSSKLDTGGLSFIVTNLWSQWKGPVNDESLKYADFKLFSDNDYAESFYKKADYHLENAYMFNCNEDGTNRDSVNNLIKQFIYNGYGVDVSFYIKSYDETTNSAYTYYDHSLANHSVAIIGWDDSFTAKNFDGNTGAWLVKNSWGTDFGDAGYFYIAYADTTLCDFTVFDIGEKSNYTTNYQHDSFIPAQAMAADNDTAINKPSYMANIFTAEETQQIEAVSTYILNPHTDYEITVYTDLKDVSDPVSGTPSAVTRGTSQLTGYLTLELNENVIVDKGESFAVVVSLYCKNSKYVLPVEASLLLEKDGKIREDVLGGFSSYNQICRFTSENESFYSSDGRNWTDVTAENYLYTEEEKNSYFNKLIEEYKHHIVWLTVTKDDIAELKAISEDAQIKAIMGNMALKAFGNPVNTVDFSHIEGVVPSDEKVSLSVKDDSDIYVSVNGGEYVLYTNPIEIKEDTVISATTDNITYTEKKYTPAKAEFNSLMYSVITGDNQIYNALDAEKTADGNYYIVLGGVEESISFIPYTKADVYLNGEPVETNKFSDFFELHAGKNVFTFELKQENGLDNTITVNVIRDLVSFDLINETVSLNDVSSLVAYDGHVFTDGESVSDYTGQILTATFMNEVYFISVPDRAELPFLEVDYLNETINFIPNEMADDILYSVKENPTENDFIPAEKRYIDGQHITSGMIMNSAFRIIPGETVTLKVKPSEGKFASIPQTFELKQVENIPSEEPQYSVSDKYFEIEQDNILEIGVVNEPVTMTELENQADLFGYSVEEFTQIMMKRHGVSDVDTLRKVMAVEWNAAFRFERTPNEDVEVAVRYYCLNDAFASCMKFSELTYRMRGDADCNGRVDSSDATVVLAYYAAVSTGGNPDMTPSQLYGCDFNEDGFINSSDASEILNYYAMKSTGQL